MNPWLSNSVPDGLAGLHVRLDCRRSLTGATDPEELEAKSLVLQQFAWFLVLLPVGFLVPVQYRIMSLQFRVSPKTAQTELQPTQVGRSAIQRPITDEFAMESEPTYAHASPAVALSDRHSMIPTPTRADGNVLNGSADRAVVTAPIMSGFDRDLFPSELTPDSDSPAHQLLPGWLTIPHPILDGVWLRALSIGFRRSMDFRSVGSLVFRLDSLDSLPMVAARCPTSPRCLCEAVGDRCARSIMCASRFSCSNTPRSVPC